MNPRIERIKLWADDLLKPENKQAKGMLTIIIVAQDGTETRGDCCLGRACTVAKANGARIAVTRKKIAWPGMSNYQQMLESYRTDSGMDIPDGSTVYKEMYSGEGSTLPYTVRRHYGIDDDNPMLRFADGRQWGAVTANDTQGYWFADIGRAVRITYGISEEDSPSPGS